MLNIPLSGTSKRVVLPFGGRVDMFLRELVAGGEVWGMSFTSTQLPEVVAYALRQWGTIESLTLSLWSLRMQQAEELVGYHRQGRVKAIRLYLDECREFPEVAAYLDKRFGERLTWCKMHAKSLALRFSGGRTIAIVTSQESPSIQSEWWWSTPNPDVYDWLTRSLEGMNPDLLPGSLELSKRIASTPYARRKGSQDVRAHLTAACRKLDLPTGTTAILGGPDFPTQGLLASLAAQMPEAPSLSLSAWWMSQQSTDGMLLLESASLIKPPQYVLSNVMGESCYGNQKVADYFAQQVPRDRVKFADVHAKLALLECPGVEPALVASTANWQTRQPRTELYIVTRDPVACEMGRRWLTTGRA